MKIITAPEQLEHSNCSVFLAGGIMNCVDWQKSMCNDLTIANEHHEIDIVFNPRRDVFPMDDPKEGLNQIKWEVKAIKYSHIFSIWFCNSTSDQPICMYELGSQVTKHKLAGTMDRIVVGIEPGYSREFDVRTQLEIQHPVFASSITDNLDDHLENIIQTSKQLIY